MRSKGLGGPSPGRGHWPARVDSTFVLCCSMFMGTEETALDLTSTGEMMTLGLEIEARRGEEEAGQGEGNRERL